LPRAASRSLRVFVARGSIPYSAVTQPRPLSFRKGGTRSSTLAVHSTRVSPNSTSTEPSAWRVKPALDAHRAQLVRRPAARPDAAHCGILRRTALISEMACFDVRVGHAHEVGLGGGEVLHDGRQIVVGHGARLFVDGVVLAPAQRQHADIIALRPGAALGEAGKLGNGLLERRRPKRLHELALGNRPPQAVGAQHQHVAARQARLGDGIGPRRHVSAQALQDAVALGVNARRLLRNAPRVDELLHHRVVAGLGRDAPLPHQIEAAVADMRPIGVAVLDQARHDHRARPVGKAEPECLAQDRAVRVGERGVEEVLRVGAAPGARRAGTRRRSGRWRSAPPARRRDARPARRPRPGAASARCASSPPGPGW
jgi:hypothetical protein